MWHATSRQITWPAGWDDALSAEARLGVEAFNRGDYFDQHEHFEHAWLAESRPVREMYQGILQVGVAFLQIERDNWAGALKMFRRGLPRLRTLPPICQGVDIAAFRSAAEAIHADVTVLGPERLHEFRSQPLPKDLLQRVGNENSSPRKGRQQRKQQEGPSCCFRCCRPFRGLKFSFPTLQSLASYLPQSSINFTTEWTMSAVAWGRPSALARAAMRSRSALPAPNQCASVRPIAIGSPSNAPAPRLTT